MNKIIKYKIIREMTDELLEFRINEYIKKGWQPYGTMVVSNATFYQPIVTYEKEN